MKTSKTTLNRRRFIYNASGLLALSTIAASNIFANEANTSLKICTIGLDAEKSNSLAKLIANNTALSITAQIQKADIHFINEDSFLKVQKQIKSNSIIIVEETQNKIFFEELVALCKSRSIYLAEIVKWTTNENSEKVFEKIIFYESKFNHQSVAQSINYLNVLSKITSNLGLIIA